MATFEFWYSETIDSKGWFEADSLEHAKELIEKVREFEIDVEELPEFFSKEKGNERQIDTPEQIA
jgi:hypothetical protein